MTETNQNFTLEKFDNAVEVLKNAWDSLIAFFKETVKTVAEVCKAVLDCIFQACTDNPKWFHYYKNASRHRIREKYRKKLQRECIKRICGGENQ
jgi:hypothetical protein